MSSRKWDGPREKIRLKGAASLTTLELLQVVIGSGNGYANVAKIARKTLRLLNKEGVGVSYEQLSGVPGLGPARVCQILAMFEISTRYSISTSQVLLDTTEKGVEALSDVRRAKQETVTVVMLDGGYRLIGTHLFLVGEKHPTELLRQIFISILRDKADKVIVGVGSKDRKLEPTMFDLVFARDMRSMSRLCRVSVKDLLIVNETSERRVYVAKRE